MEFEVRVAKGARRSGKGGGKWWPLRRRWRPLQTCTLVIFEGMLKMAAESWFSRVTESREHPLHTGPSHGVYDRSGHLQWHSRNSYGTADRDRGPRTTEVTIGQLPPQPLSFSQQAAAVSPRPHVLSRFIRVSSGLDPWPPRPRSSPPELLLRSRPAASPWPPHRPTSA